MVLKQPPGLEFKDNSRRDLLETISHVPRGNHRQKTKLQETSRLR